MSMARDDLLYLDDIQEAIETIFGYVQGIEVDEFKQQQMLQDAVVRQIEIIGEATKHLSEGIRKANPQVPWRAIAGTRDRLIHGYFAVDLDEIWLTIQQDLPVLRQEVTRLLSES